VVAWRHLHDLFAERGADNVRWVWCPNATAFTDRTAQQFYPGDGYVDWVCADGYDYP
jgi:beta-mannanase